MEKLLDRITPKKIILILLLLYVFSTVWIEFIPSRYYKTLFGVFHHVGFFYTLLMFLAADLYSLRFCTLHPQFTAFQYGAIIYSSPFGLLLGTVFLLSLKRVANKRAPSWIIAFIWTLLIILASSAQLFTYFCYPMRFY